MGRTFNRSPLSMGVPTASDVKQYYFNHYNWKGINQNKNFLLVDQETFADALNVYADDKNLLKSRPALKFAYEWSGREIIDIKVFDDIFVIGYKETGGNYIAFADADGILTVCGTVMINFPIKCFRNGSMIYVFTDGFIGQPGGPRPQSHESILQFDMVLKKLSYADTYNAVTRIYTGNRYVEYESENLFSNYSKYRYVLFPSIVSKDYVHDSISLNAYGKDCTYSHSINEEIITHDVYIDSNGDFLGKIHQTLSYDSNNYHITNVYGVDVPTYFIKDDIVYRFNDGRVEKASTSTMIFETIFKENKFDKANFVKIKPQDAGYITVIYKDGVRRINYDGTTDLDINSLSNLLGYDFFIDVAEIRAPVDGNVTLIPVGIGFASYENPDDPTSKKYFSVATFYDRPSKSLVRLRLSNFHEDTLLTEIKCSGEIDINHNKDSLKLTQCFSLSYKSNNSYFEDVVSYSVGFFYTMYGNVQKDTEEGSFAAQTNYVYLDRDAENHPEIAQGKLLNTVKIDSQEYKTVVTASILLRPSKDSEKDLLRYGTVNEGYNFNLEFSDSLETDSDVQHYYNNTLYFLKDDKFYYYYKDNKSELITDLKGTPVLNSYSNYWLYAVPEKNVVLSNYKSESVNVDTLIEKENKYKGTDVLFKDSEIYLAKGNDLFIGNVVTDESENESLYFRKIDKNTFDTDINGIWKISDNLIGLFFDDSTTYCSKSGGVYYFVDSKIVPRLKGKSSLITLKDSTTTLLPSGDGVYLLSYQDFVNTTEQSTKNISEDISDLYLLFKGDVQMINYKNYTILYENQNKNILIFDLRYSGWWLWNLPVNVTNLFFNDDTLFVIGDGKVYRFVETSENYFDFVDDKIKIDWHVQSQKLHLNANNYYKHIYNITLQSVDDDSVIAMRLDVNNYRKYVDNGKKETFKYFIDVLRTFVKRLNYSKVCEFQYTLASDTKDGGNAINFPLSLSDITIKYDIGGQVR